MEEVHNKKLMTPRLIILLMILVVGVVAALYMWLVYVPYMRELYDEFEFTPVFEELNLDGDGTPQDPFLIRTPEDLAELARKVQSGSTYAGKYFTLMNDLDMTDYLSENGAGHNRGEGWLPIGIYESTTFNGIFDGMGHTVSGLWLNRPNLISAGLFGRTQNAEIYRLNVEAASIAANSSVAALVGFMDGGVMINCSARANVLITRNVAYANSLGLLAGFVTNGAVIDDCTSSGVLEIYADLRGMTLEVGGLVGGLSGSGILRNSRSTAEIYIEGDVMLCAGGLVGTAEYRSTVDRCYSGGSVKAVTTSALNARIGGLTGYAVGENTVIRNSGSSCDVVVAGGGLYSGGFVGELDENAEIINCYAMGNIACTNDNEEYNYLCIHGGFAGEASGVIIGSYASGSVSTGNNCYSAGGFVGQQNAGLIKDCYATGTIVFGNTNNGGFAGYQNKYAEIENCYSTGAASKGFYNFQIGTVENSFFDTETSGARSAGIQNFDSTGEAVGKTTAEMQSIETFSGWDFTVVWLMPENDYPRLRNITLFTGR